MNITDLPFLHEDDSGFMNVSESSQRSLSEIFATSDLSTSPDWDLSDHEFMATSDEVAQEIDLVARKEVFKKIKHGTQDENIGDIRVAVAEEYCEILNESSAETHIVFSADRLQNPISGGTCSAMSFEFADSYLEKRATMSPSQIFDEIGPKFENSSKKFRTRQAVFNTLHRDEKSPPEDFMQAKVGSMLRFFDRSITDSSEVFYIKDTLMMDPSSAILRTATKKIEPFLKKHPEGVFVIRCIILDDNDKGERLGHSTVLIREKDESYFYDPNEGIFELPKKTEALVGILTPMMQRWSIPHGRIYKIQ